MEALLLHNRLRASIRPYRRLPRLNPSLRVSIETCMSTRNSHFMSSDRRQNWPIAPGLSASRYPAWGAAAMLADGLFTRFQKPDFAISMHDEPSLPSGKVGFHGGFFRASSDSVDVTIFGRGGHGARPQLTVDPVVLAARAILGIQTIVSRETDPLSPAVVTIGSIHGGTAGNIIPDEVRMLMSVRSYDEKVRKHLLESIKRQLDAEAPAV